MSDAPAYERPRWSIAGSASITASDPGLNSVLQSRMSSLQREVGELARGSDPLPLNSSVGSGDAVPIEKLISSHREQANEIASLNQIAAQREAQIGSLQAQLTQAQLHIQKMQQTQEQLSAQVHEERQQREQMTTQHTQAMVEAQNSFTAQHAQLHQRLAGASQAQAAQQAAVGRLGSLVTQAHRWLHALFVRCASSNIELPVECKNALSLLHAATNAIPAGSFQPDSMPSAAATGVAASAVHATSHALGATVQAVSIGCEPPTTASSVPAPQATSTMKRAVVVTASPSAVVFTAAPSAAADAPATSVAVHAPPVSQAVAVTQSRPPEPLGAVTAHAYYPPASVQAVPVQPPSAPAVEACVQALDAMEMETHQNSRALETIAEAAATCTSWQAATLQSGFAGERGESILLSATEGLTQSGSGQSGGAVDVGMGTPDSTCSSLSPGRFLNSLLASPDMLQLMSPQVTQASVEAVAASNQLPASGFSQFKRRQGSKLPPNPVP